MNAGPPARVFARRWPGRGHSPALIMALLLVCVALVAISAIRCLRTPLPVPGGPREAAQPEAAALKGRSALVLANLDQTAPAAVTLLYRRPDGTVAGQQQEQLAPGAMMRTLHGQALRAPDGFSGSMELSSDRPVRLLVQHAEPGRRSATYEPALLREALYHELSPLWKTSTIVLYNPAATPCSVAFSAREQGSARSAVERGGLNIPPYGQLQLSLERLPELPAGWTGAGSVRSLGETPVRVLVIHTDARRTYATTSRSVIRDVCDLCPYAGAINMLVSAGVLALGPDGGFRPAEELTHDEAERIRTAEDLPAGAVPAGTRRDEAAARLLEALRRQPPRP